MTAINLMYVLYVANHKAPLPIIEKCDGCNGYMYRDCLVRHEHSLHCKKKYVWCDLCNKSVNHDDIVKKVHRHSASGV